jgi:hypothetical protein
LEEGIIIMLMDLMRENTERGRACSLSIHKRAAMGRQGC